MRDKLIKHIEHVDYHRNGISGEGFHVVTFISTEGDRPMVGVFFGCDQMKEGEQFFKVNPCVAVFDRELLGQGEVRFFHNSYRGDRFADELLAAIKKRDASYTPGEGWAWEGDA